MSDSSQSSMPNWLSWIPISKRTQAVLAEILSQSLAAGMDVVQAFAIASQVVPGWRVRWFLRAAAEQINSGYTLVHSLQLVRMPIHQDLLAAMDIGEERGRLDVELSAAAKRLDPNVHQHLMASLGRRKSVQQFAASLARLLAEHPLTLSLVSDAGRLVGERDARFQRMLERLLEDIEGGSPFADALVPHSDVFDPFFIHCISHAETRDSTRRILARLGGQES